MIRKDNAQLYTVEGIAASIMMLLVVIFIIKAAPLSSSTSSTSNKNVEAQLELMGQDFLTILDYGPNSSDSPLKGAIMEWGGQEFDGQKDLPSLPEPLKEGLSDPLIEALGYEGIAYNLEVSYNTGTGVFNRRMLWNGRPSDNAVTVTRKVTLHNKDLKYENLRKIITDIDGNGTGLIDTDFYNTVMVRLTLWRI